MANRKKKRRHYQPPPAVGQQPVTQPPRPEGLPVGVTLILRQHTLGKWEASLAALGISGQVEATGSTLQQALSLVLNNFQNNRFHQTEVKRKPVPLRPDRTMTVLEGVDILRETDKAFQVEAEGTVIWLPKSQMAAPGDYCPGDAACSVRVTEWWVKEVLARFAGTGGNVGRSKRV